MIKPIKQIIYLYFALFSTILCMLAITIKEIYQQENFFTQPQNTGLPFESPNQSALQYMFKDNENNLWAIINTQNHSPNFSQLYEKTPIVNKYFQFTSGLPTSEGCFFYKMIEDNKQTLWLTTSIGLFYKNQNSNTFIQFTNGFPSSPYSIDDITIDKLGNIVTLLVTGDYRDTFLYEKNINQVEFVNIDSAQQIPVAVHICMFDHNNKLWVGTISISIWTKEANSSIFVRYTDGLSDFGYSFNKNIFEDSENNIWIVFATPGYIFKKPFNSTTFTRIILPDQPSHGDVNISSIFQDSENNIWIGLYNLYIKTYDSDNFIKFDSGLPKNLLTNPIIGSIFEDKNIIWLGYDSSLYCSINGQISYTFTPGSENCTYNDENKERITSNKTIIFWSNLNIVDKVIINGINFANYETFSLDGTDYNAKNKKYNITIQYSDGRADSHYYFEIKDSIVNPDKFNFHTDSGNYISKYTGYLNGDKNNQVLVYHTYNLKSLSEGTLKFNLQSEYIIDWADTYYQQLDQATLKPIGMKVFLSPNIQDISNSGLYLLHIKDKLGNELNIYVQIGGKEKIIPETPVGPQLSIWLLSIIIIGSILFVATIISFIIYRIFMKHQKNKLNK